MSYFRMRWMGVVITAELAFALPTVLNAAPITYDFYLVTSGSLNGVSFDNALVHFRTESDTTKAIFYPSFGGQSAIWLNTYGVTTVSIMTNGRMLRARIRQPLFVSIDQKGGGVGLGSYDSSGNVDPTYPVGIQDGIPDCIIGDGDCVAPSAATSALATDLVSSTILSGRAWSDSCFLQGGGCDGPTLTTSAGPFQLKRPYTASTDPLVTGIFRATVH
jgi:hypothetical protein